MKVERLDHVNIVTDRLEETADFYAAVLGLERQANASAPLGFAGAWMVDATGDAIIHLVGYRSERHAGRHLTRDDGPPIPTGAIDHVALRCEGFAAMRARLEGMGIEHRVNDRQFGDLRQIFVHDPNKVTLELNFPGD